jgi:hypothetical protein
VHGIDYRDVNRVIVGIPGLRYVWHENPGRGRRALLEVIIEGRLCIVVLYPVKDALGDFFALWPEFRRFLEALRLHLAAALRRLAGALETAGHDHDHTTTRRR